MILQRLASKVMLGLGPIIPLPQIQCIPTSTTSAVCPQVRARPYKTLIINTQANKQKFFGVHTDNFPYPVLIELCPIKYLC